MTREELRNAAREFAERGDDESFKALVQAIFDMPFDEFPDGIVSSPTLDTTVTDFNVGDLWDQLQQS